MSAAIHFSGAAKIYRRSHLGRTTETIGIADLNLDIFKGEVFGLLGLNGSGKTTTIKLLMGLHAPTHGFVEVLGRRVPDLDILKRVGYAPEAAYLNRALTGRETLMLFAALSGIAADERKHRVTHILMRVGMTAGANVRLADYSKGMLQRISLAQALIHDPELVIMDEPGTGLDPLAIKETRALILNLKERGKTLLFSSHDISEVEQVCDRIGILTQGRLARVIERSQWQARAGFLEDAFVKSVSRTDGVGEIKFE